MIALADRLLEELRKRCSPGCAVKGVGRLLEFDPVKEALYISGDGIRCHDQNSIERVNILAGDRSC